MTELKFEYAGFSTLNGKQKIRFANDIMRFKTLVKNGHEDIVLDSLPAAMTKPEAVRYLTERHGVNDALRRAAKKYRV